MDIEPNGNDQIKAKFNEICTPFINQMSDKLIVSVNDILKQSNTTLRTKKFEEKFKSNMIDRWTDEFNRIWNTRKLDEHLTMLNAKKQQLKDTGTTEKAWRAHGHTPSEQTQNCRNRLMALHLIHLKELLEQQSSDLQKLIFEVKERRTFINEVSMRRSKVVDEIDSKIQQLQRKLIETD